MIGAARRAVFAAAVSLAGFWPAAAGAADANDFPPTLVYDGQTLVRNGVGERTFSILGIRIYEAALYLTRPSHDPDEIIDRIPTRVFVFRFLHDVDAEHARASWSEGFEDNCGKPCDVNESLITGFLDRVTPLNRGDVTILAVVGDMVTAQDDQRSMGSVQDPAFAKLVLRSFLGPKPPSEALKRGLLGEG